MKFLQQASSNLVPILARILLFLAFVPTGWHHAMEQTLFTGAEAARIRELGIASAPHGFAGGTQMASLQDTPPLPAVAMDAQGVQARSLHELTLFFDGRGLPKPMILAWTVTIFELIGGALVLAGLFTRLWSGGLAIWALGLFVVSTPSLGEAFASFWKPTDPAAAMPRTLALSQLGLLVLALWVTASGAGRFSLDGLIFKGRGGDGGSDDE
jgi:uncharacterized membrane protein YphA (DoxX/SURF4 family)